MTNYFKVYLTSKNKRQCVIAKNKAEVINVLNRASKEEFLSFLVVRRIKNTDVIIGNGNFSKECKVIYVDGLDTDWRVVGYRVVDYKRYKENEEEER